MPHKNAPDFGTVSVDSNWKITIVSSLWQGEMTSALTADAQRELVSLGVPEDHIQIITVPGAWELPLASKKALQKSDAVIAFGVLIDGDTHHADLIAKEVATGLMQVQLEAGKPIVFELLHTKNEADAKKRSIGEQEKGAIAAKTAVTALAELREI